MNQKSVGAVIVVFFCFCLSFGNGDKRIDDARKSLRKHHRLLRNLNNPNALRPQSTIYMYIREVNDKERTWQDWVQLKSGYSPEQLSNPPESMNEDELKLATEYHLWQSEWFHVRLIALDKAAENARRVDSGIPTIYECRDAALKALRNWKYHRDTYLKYRNALGEKARQGIMEENQFSKYTFSQLHYYNNPVSDHILIVMIHLEKLIKGLFRRKAFINSSAVKEQNVIAFCLTPSGKMFHNELMIKLQNCFSVADFSKFPDKSFAIDEPFLEVGWLFNRYRSLWYEIRSIEFQKFLRHKVQSLNPEFIKRVKEDLELTNMSFQQYKSLYIIFFRALMKSHEGLEQEQSGGERKRIRKIASPGAHETAENQYMEETVGSNTPVYCRRGAEGAQLDLELSLAPPVIEDARAIPEFDLNVALIETGETEEDAFEVVDSAVPKRLRLTESADKHFRRCSNADGVNQTPLEKCISECSRTGENSNSASKTQLFNFF